MTRTCSAVDDCRVPARPWILLLAFAALVAGAGYFGLRARNADRELPVHVTPLERMLVGEEIHRRGADAKAFTYPPFAAVPFVPLTLLPMA